MYVQPMNAQGGMMICPREMSINQFPLAARVGDMFVRHVTTGPDLDKVNQGLCSTYNGVIVLTAICVAENTQVCHYMCIFNL